MNQHFSLGVIGHVDHGKTSLVKAITGIDTDRLKEEKERGMSIVLGFAHLTLGDSVVDLIDVPGHEAFVRTMVAGATGIDAALLVVDAREGAKPQTAEHLAITELIGVERGVVAFTKCDLADADERAAALHHLHALLKGTYLESSPKVFTSCVTGEGLEELKQELKGLCRQRRHADAGRFHLPIDRSFSIAGRGTVVTGTLRTGSLRVGDEVELMPKCMRAKVRQIECHKQSVGAAWPGQRVGVNLRGVTAEDAARGQVLAPIGMLRSSTLLDVQLTVVRTPGYAVSSGQRVRLLFGTTDVGARVRVMSGKTIEPGEAAMVQLRTACPVTAVAGEPFIIRLETPQMTVGGGRVLDPVAVRHRLSDPDVLLRLHVLADGTMEAKLVEHLKAAGYGGIALTSLSSLLGVPEGQEKACLNERIAVTIDHAHALYRPFVESLCDMVLAALRKFHKMYPAKSGAPLSHCRASLPRSAGESVFKFVMQRLYASKLIAMRNGKVHCFGYDPFSVLNAQDREAASAIESKVRKGGWTPPDIGDLTGEDERRLELLYMLAERGNLLLLPIEHGERKLVFHSEAIDEAVQRTAQAFPPPAQFTVSELRELLGTTRKFAVPLLEYFDSAGYTRRKGDRRVVVGKVA